MDDAANTRPSELPLTQSWTDETPLDQIPAEHRLRVADERAEAAKKADAEKAEAAKKATPAAGSRASTKARVTNPKPKTGRRVRKADEAEAVEPEAERVAVVLKTSRYTGRHGRAVARKSTVLVTVDRGLKLLMLDHAREATEAEAAAALVKPIYVD